MSFLNQQVLESVEDGRRRKRLIDRLAFSGIVLSWILYFTLYGSL